MNWLKINWRWALLNAVAVIAVITVLTRGDQNPNNTRTFDPMLESGKWAIRFLLFSLAMSPLNNLFGWRSGIKLRKTAGLWAFGFGALHLLLLITENTYFDGLQWLWFPWSPFIVFGVIGLSILTALAITSNQWSMKRLGKHWKRLHRLVYVAGLAVVYHAILAASGSKRIFIRDPQVIYELHIYLVILTLLLLVRIPAIRSQLKHLPLIRLTPTTSLPE